MKLSFSEGQQAILDKSKFIKSNTVSITDYRIIRLPEFKLVKI